MNGEQKTDLLANLGQHISRLREQRGSSREQLAESSGLTLIELEQIECGELPGSPTIEMLRRICGALGLELSELFDLVESRFDVRLVLLRERRHWSRQRLAEASRLDIGTIEDLETGKLSPTLKMLRQLARGMGLKVSEMFEDSEPT